MSLDQRRNNGPMWWNPARAGAFAEGEGPVVGVEHHLLGLARIGPHEGHPAVAEPDMGDLDLTVTPSISTTSWLQSNW